MFHKAGGKIFFYVVTLMFFILSIQNTWAFLNKTMPDASPTFLVCMMIVFEGGFLGWLAMLMHGAENVYRVGISFVMLLITGTGVFVGAYFEIGGMMHAGIGYKVDPNVLAWVPFSVLLAYMATGAACVLYMLASPEFFHRMSHMNATGQAPAQFQMIPTGQPFNFSISQAPDTEPLALPAPQGAQTAPLAPAKPSVFRRAAGAVGDWFNGAKKDAQTVAAGNSQQPVNAAPEPSNGVQQPAQNGAQPAPQNGGSASLGMIEQAMLDAFMQAPADQQQALQDYAAQHTPAELTAYLQQQYPSYARYFTEARVGNVMAAWRAAQPQPQMQNSAPKRAASARRKPASTGTRKSASSANSQRRASMQTILPLLDQANPGLSDADLAKLAGCSPSTVNRWRASLAKTAQPVNA
jgi:hypothetical protein